jgi:hypothetical protein
VADVTKQIEYIGPPALVGAFAQCLRDEGVEVHYEPPLEERGVPSEVIDVVVIVTAMGLYDAIKAGMGKYRERFRLGRTKIEGEDDE